MIEAMLLGHMIKVARTNTPFVHKAICHEIDRVITNELQ